MQTNWDRRVLVRPFIEVKSQKVIINRYDPKRRLNWRFHPHGPFLIYEMPEYDILSQLLVALRVVAIASSFMLLLLQDIVYYILPHRERIHRFIDEIHLLT